MCVFVLHLLLYRWFACPIVELEGNHSGCEKSCLFPQKCNSRYDNLVFAQVSLPSCWHFVLIIVIQNLDIEIFVVAIEQNLQIVQGFLVQDLKYDVVSLEQF